jgi:hypothetical protein
MIDETHSATVVTGTQLAIIGKGWVLSGPLFHGVWSTLWMSRPR